MSIQSTVIGPRLIGVALLFILTVSISLGNNLPISKIAVQGDLPFSERKALKLIGIKPGDLFEETKAIEGYLALRQGCVNRYYPLAEAAWSVQRDSGNRSVTLIYRVNSGRRGKLLGVRFAGNASIASSNLLDVITYKPAPGLANWFFGRDVLEVEKLTNDQKSIADFYIQQGFLDVQVGPAKLDYNENHKGYILSWPIMDEGRQYHVKNILIEGPLRPSDEDLAGIMTFRPGDPFASSKADESRLALETFFKLNGYAFAAVEVKADVNMAETKVDVRYDIEAGNQPGFSKLQIDGNKVTADRVFQREVTVKKGDVFYPPVLEASKSRILMLPMVESATMDIVPGSDTNLFDVVLNLEEKRTGRFEVGYVYGEIEGGAFLLNVREQNLKLSPPFRGDALQGNVNITAGSEILGIDLSVLNPRVHDSYWSLEGRGTAEDNQYASEYYDQRNLETSLIAGHPVGVYQAANAGIVVQDLDVYDVIPDVTNLISETEDDVFMTSIALGWSYDRSNRSFRPDRGFRLRGTTLLGTRLLGGDEDLVQYQANGSLFLGTFRDHILVFRAGGEGVSAYGKTSVEPYSTRVFLGGSSDLRGFGYHTVSPVDEEGRLTGGEVAWFTTLEYLYPVSSIVDFALYYDIGDVSASDYDAEGGPPSNWGLGLMIRADNFPVRFDVAFPVNTYKFDTQNEKGDARLSFSAGYRY